MGTRRHPLTKTVLNFAVLHLPECHPSGIVRERMILRSREAAPSLLKGDLVFALYYDCRPPSCTTLAIDSPSGTALPLHQWLLLAV